MTKNARGMSHHAAKSAPKAIVMAALFGAVLGLGAAPAAAALSADQVKRQVEARYGVEVLRIVPMAEQGRSAYAVTIMNPGGNFNEAFQVNTLVIDARTGRPVIQYRHGPGGRLHPPAPPVATRTPPNTASTP